MSRRLLKFSSPSRGSYISTMKMKNGKELNKVLVPFPGFLYLYYAVFSDYWLNCKFSSPSRGSYISTLSSQSLELYTHISAFAAQM